MFRNKARLPGDGIRSNAALEDTLIDPDRKRQILKAEERFALLHRLSRALAEKGVYIFGKLTHDPSSRLSNPASEREADGYTASTPPDAGAQ